MKLFIFSGFVSLLCGILLYSTFVWRWRYEFLEEECLKRGYIKYTYDEENPMYRKIVFKDLP